MAHGRCLFGTALDEVSEIARRLLDQATAAATVAELRTEIQTLERLEERARKVRFSGTDTKWTELSTILDDPLMIDFAAPAVTN